MSQPAPTPAPVSTWRRCDFRLFGSHQCTREQGHAGEHITLIHAEDCDLDEDCSCEASEPR